MDAVVPGVWQGQGQPVLVWMFIAVVTGVWHGQGQPVLVWMLWCQASGRDRANQS